MMTSRRAFLAQAAAAPLVFGVPLAGCSPVPAPAWLPDALSRIRSEGRLGLAVHLPRDPAARCAVGHRLTRLLNSDRTDVHEVLADLVIVCLEEATFRGKFGAGRAGEVLLLIDGDGYPIEGLGVFPETPEGFAGALRGLIDGPDGARGRERAQTARGRSSADALVVLEKAESGAGVAAILRQAPPLMPLLVAERHAAGATPRGERLREAIELHYASLSETERGPRLPFGIELSAQVRGGCGDCGCEEKPPTNMIVACGMGRMPLKARSFVKFLAL